MRYKVFGVAFFALSMYVMFVRQDPTMAFYAISLSAVNYLAAIEDSVRETQKTTRYLIRHAARNDKSFAAGLRDSLIDER